MRSRSADSGRVVCNPEVMQFIGHAEPRRDWRLGFFSRRLARKLPLLQGVHSHLGHVAPALRNGWPRFWLKGSRAVLEEVLLRGLEGCGMDSLFVIQLRERNLLSRTPPYRASPNRELCGSMRKAAAGLPHSKSLLHNIMRGSVGGNFLSRRVMLPLLLHSFALFS